MNLFARLTGLSVVTAIIAILILFLQASSTASQFLEKAATNQLTSTLADRKVQLQYYLSSLQEELSLYANLPMTREALAKFSASYQNLEHPQHQLQQAYIAQNPHKKGEKDNLVQSNMVPSYDALHGQYHPNYRDWQQKSELYDVFLVDEKGNLVYSVFKETDYATNLINGAWQKTGLADVFNQINQSKMPDSLSFVDFAPYNPSNGAPASFMASPVFHDVHGYVGAIIIQMPIGRINKILNSSIGLGKTGETYLVSANKMMLSDSRFSDQSTILKQKVDTNAVNAALAGQNGIINADDYRGQSVYSAFDTFSPFVNTISPPVKWILLAEIDAQEALQAVAEMQNTLTFIGVLITLAALFAGILGARSISQPIVQIQKALSKLANGEQVNIPGIDRKDEIGEMAKSANAFKELSLLTIENNRLQQQIGKLTKLYTEENRDNVSASELTRFLHQELNVPVILIYSTKDNGNTLTLDGSIGIEKRNHANTIYTIDDGLIGLSIRERKPITLSPVPEGMAQITSGMGNGNLQEIHYFPILHNGKVLAVIEIGVVEKISTAQRDQIESLFNRLGLLIVNIRSATSNRILLKETQEQAKVLEENQTELNQANAELQAQTEELKAQTEELKATEEELRAQQEELNSKNAVLESSTKKLQQTQKETELKAEELTRANKYKSEFLANMSHELRTPLNSILILSQDLAENETGTLNEDQIESAQVINDSGSSLLRLINDILDLSKIEAGKLDIHIESFDVNDVFVYLRRVFQPQADKRNIGLVFDHKSELSVFNNDHHRLLQILTNIMSNAIKFTEHGQVTVSATQTEQRLMVEVTDTGIGISPDKIDHVFGAFNQADGSTSRKFGGTGLGLAITKSLAGLLGGDIKVTSEYGKGSCFTVDIINSSLNKEEVNDNSNTIIEGQSKQITSVPEISETPKSKPFSSTSKDKYLIVEDDARLVRILEKMIDSLGYHVISSETGELALTKLNEEVITGVLLDLGLPGISGFDVLKDIKGNERNQHIPVVIMSGAEDTGEARKLGALDFITKPVTKNAIADAIKQMQANFKLQETSVTNNDKKILLLEDNKEMVSAIQKLFHQDDLQIDVTSTGKQGLELINQQSYQVIILDIGLEDMSGFTWLTELKKNNKIHPSIIVYSAQDLSSDECNQLNEFTDTIIVKNAHSQHRLRDEVLDVLNTEQEVEDIEKLGTNRQGNILLVDDDQRNLFALSKALKNKGFNLTLANSAQKALEYMKNSDFDILATDIMMPDMDGFELIKKVRANGMKDLPIIALTAKAMQADQEECFAAGANDYMSKPINVEQLIKKFEQWL